MTLLLLDLDDTLVDRGRIFGQWLADFTRPLDVSDEDLAWITALDGGGYTDAAGVLRRCGPAPRALGGGAGPRRRVDPRLPRALPVRPRRT